MLRHGKDAARLGYRYVIIGNSSGKYSTAREIYSSNGTKCDFN
jgi:hypothetical protein